MVHPRSSRMRKIKHKQVERRPKKPQVEQERKEILIVIDCWRGNACEMKYVIVNIYIRDTHCKSATLSLSSFRFNSEKYKSSTPFYFYSCSLELKEGLCNIWLFIKYCSTCLAMHSAYRSSIYVSNAITPCMHSLSLFPVAVFISRDFVSYALPSNARLRSS